MNMLIRAEMMAPRDSIRQMLLTISMVETAATPRVEQKNTRALVRMEVSAEVGISQAQVSRLEKNAINQIKKNL